MFNTRGLKQDQRAIETERSKAIETRFNSKTIRTGCSANKILFFPKFVGRPSRSVRSSPLPSFDFPHLIFSGFSAVTAHLEIYFCHRMSTSLPLRFYLSRQVFNERLVTDSKTDFKKLINTVLNRYYYFFYLRNLWVNIRDRISLIK